MGFMDKMFSKPSVEKRDAEKQKQENQVKENADAQLEKENEMVQNMFEKDTRG